MSYATHTHLQAADRHALAVLHHLERLAIIDPENKILYAQAAMLHRRVRGVIVGRLAAERAGQRP